MSGDGKRSDAEWPKLPRPSSTLPDPQSRPVRKQARCWRLTDGAATLLVLLSFDPKPSFRMREQIVRDGWWKADPAPAACRVAPVRKGRSTEQPRASTVEGRSTSHLSHNILH